MIKTAITKCYDYSGKQLEKAIYQVCENSDFPLVSGKKVLIKPNILSDADPSECITTNPEFVRYLIRYVKSKGAAQVIVGDSPGMQGPNFKALKCKIGTVCEQENVAFADFTENPDNIRISGTKQTVPLAHVIKETDVIISASKFKTHQLMYTTGAVKNLFGLIPSRNKSHCHLLYPNRDSFACFICSLHETVKPSYSIMDAVIGMEGPGPANGKPKAVNLILGSSDAFALDYAQAVIMGYNPKDIPILKVAEQRKLLPAEIEYPLLSPSDLIIKDYKKVEISRKDNFFRSLVLPFFTRSLQKKRQKKEIAPYFNENKCIKCLRCVKICPAEALSLNGGRITLDSSKCIRCYCCHEMCSENAISISAEKK